MSTVEFDEQTHLPKRVAYDTQQAGGAPIYSEDVYEDFRNVGGILMPFKLTINQGGRRVVNEALAALGGKAFLAMEDRVETGRAYSFFREELQGLDRATVYTRY